MSVHPGQVSSGHHFDAIYADDMAYGDFNLPVDQLVPAMEVVPLRSQVSYSFEYKALPPGASFHIAREAAQAAFNQQLQASFQQQFNYHNQMIDMLSGQLNQVYTNNQVVTRLVDGQIVSTPRPLNTVWCEIHGGLREIGTLCMYCEKAPKTVTCYIDEGSLDRLFEPRPE